MKGKHTTAAASLADGVATAGGAGVATARGAEMALEIAALTDSSNCRVPLDREVPLRL